MYAYCSNYSCMPTVQTIHVCLLFKLFMYAYCSNHSCMPTVQTIHVCLLFKLFMYAYCSNYSCMPTVQTIHVCSFAIAPVQTSSYKMHKQAYYLVRCCSFAFNFQCNVFICLSSIISSCLVLKLSLYYRSSFSLRFVLFFLLHIINEKMYIVH
jgi:hypothetical protein